MFTVNVRTVTATRYVTPLREGGSLPAIVEADDDGMYVLKFRGAGQGPKALIAELVAGEVGRALGLRVPEIVFVEVDPVIGRTEPDQEIQDLINASAGLNLGIDYLPGSAAYDPVVRRTDAETASSIVWFDALVTNVDRTPRNTNMLVWHQRLWLIDHGAALYAHHAPADFRERSRGLFPQIKDHVLLPEASILDEVDLPMAERLTPELLGEIASLIPESWLDGGSVFSSPDEHRAAYAEYLTARLEAPRTFVEEARNARALSL
jgi:hypothetical protein